MSQKKYKDCFEKLYSLFTEAYLTFYVWKGLQEKEFEQIFRENNNFWSAILFALENTWLTSLAKLYEESNYSKRSTIISVYSLVPHQADAMRGKQARDSLKQHEGTIQNVRILRNNQLAHNNTEHLLNPKNILRKYPIKYTQVEELMEISVYLLSYLHPDTGHGYSFEGFAEGCQRDAKSMITKLEYFSKKKAEHRDKFLRGEVHSPQFP